MSDDLVAFLRARIDEDEAVARGTTMPLDWYQGPGDDDPEWVGDEMVLMWPPEFHTPYEQDKHWRGLTADPAGLAAHIARHDPARATPTTGRSGRPAPDPDTPAALSRTHPDRAHPCPGHPDPELPRTHAASATPTVLDQISVIDRPLAAPVVPLHAPIVERTERAPNVAVHVTVIPHHRVGRCPLR
jgi:hypothetical protein